jgi:hypothetical protein
MLVSFCNRKTVARGGSLVPHPFGISLFEEHVFFTDWTKMAVMKANKFTDTNPQVYHQSSLTPFGVTVYHALRQPNGKFLGNVHLTWNRKGFLVVMETNEAPPEVWVLCRYIYSCPER